MAFFVNNMEFANQEEFAKFGRGCATKIPNPSDILRVDREILANKQKRVIFSTLNIEVKFHHLTYGSRGLITKAQRDAQIALLNNLFKDEGITFSYNEKYVKFIDNKNWYFMGPGSFIEREAKTKLRVDSTRYLNFYTGGLEKGLLGWATFPYDLAGDPIVDGVVVLDESFPGGSQSPYNLGMTGVHEVCHWLGLYHTFQDGCSGFGDHVHDTPSHESANFGKPAKGEPHNACLNGEFAPIHNIMNYVDDEWMFELTPQQMARIKENIMMYRTGLL